MSKWPVPLNASQREIDDAPLLFAIITGATAFAR